MKELVQAIREKGIGIGEDIVKVDMLLNHRLDTELLVKMGKEFAEAFADLKPDLVLTVEASGIAFAVATAIQLGNLPVVFAKKSKSRNITGDVYQTSVFSYTHGVENHIRVSKEYLPEGCRVLIIDDFLANGAAASGLCEIVAQAKAIVAGVGVCVEKKFQPGRAKLEGMGIKVVSLASVVGIDRGKLIVED